MLDVCPANYCKKIVTLAEISKLAHPFKLKAEGMLMLN